MRKQDSGICRAGGRQLRHFQEMMHWAIEQDRGETPVLHEPTAKLGDNLAPDGLVLCRQRADNAPALPFESIADA